MSQPAEIFSVLDRDDNQALDHAEFLTLGREIFARWDADRDSNIDEDEFYAGVHDLWDVDDDEGLTLPEYDDRWSDWFAAFYYVTFAELDRDADDLIAAEEFRAGLDDTRL
jgi:Ca2+-binding EF-hand superfamily protein